VHGIHFGSDYFDLGEKQLNFLSIRFSGSKHRTKRCTLANREQMNYMLPILILPVYDSFRGCSTTGRIRYMIN
jgi:hypothetical protein